METATPNDVSRKKLLAIDAICEDFENALRGNAAPRLADALPSSWSEVDRSQLFEYLLKVEVDFRLEQGERVAAGEYLELFPPMAEAIERVLAHERFVSIPTEIGPYRIVGKLGSGGMGTVYKAHQERLERFVAIKVLPAGVFKEPAARRRFERELTSAGKVSHPNVVTAFDGGQSGETHYLVMELVEGLNLDDLARRTTIAIADACELIRQTCLGLGKIHQARLVHRDIKPANLMLGADGQVKILDLGLALLHEQTASPEPSELTNVGQVMGTFDYMAPEQCVDSHSVDSRADIYALGATLYRLLAGHVPFAHRHSLSPVGRLSAKLQETPLPLSQSRDDIPAPLVALVERMLARDPALRIASAAQVAQEIAPFCCSANLEALLVAAGKPPPSSTYSNTATPGRTYANSPSYKLVEPAPTPASRLPESWRRLAVLLSVMVLAACAVIFFLKTKNGTLRVEINDPQIIAKVVGEKVTLKKADGLKDITLMPGQRKLLVEREGFQFETSQFEIRSGKEVTLRVELLEGEIVVRNGDKILGSKRIPVPVQEKEPDPAALAESSPPKPKQRGVLGKMPGPNATEQELADYLISVGANAQLKAIDSARPNDLKVFFLRWATRNVPTDAQLAPCAQLRHLETLGYTGGNKSFQLFADCAGLKNLELGGSTVDGEGAKLLARFPKLEHIQIGCTDPDGFLRAIKVHPSISSIHIYRCALSEDTLEGLAGRKQLRKLWIDANTGPGPVTERVLQQLMKLDQLETLMLRWHDGPTEAELQQLRMALPNCTIQGP